jgi:hypothetical protein
MIYYNWTGNPITSIADIDTTSGKMYHFSTGSNGWGGVPENDVYVIEYVSGEFIGIPLNNVQLDDLGKPRIGGLLGVVQLKPRIPGEFRAPQRKLQELFNATSGKPIHEVKSSLDVAPVAPAAVGGRKNKKSHKKSQKKSQKKSHKKNKTSRRHK